MNYEEMVKEAYEEIIGLDKEAAPKVDRINKYKDYYSNSGSQQKLMNAAADRALIREERAELRDKMKAAKGTDEYAALKAKNKELKKERNKNILTQLNPITNAKANIGHALKSPKQSLLGVYGGMGEAFDDDAAKTRIAVDTYNKRKAERAAEKAAAYYDEAQLVKEAAEADYAEACAYEEAALAILDELGYLD